MQYLDAISKMTEWTLFISRANHSISEIQVCVPTINTEEDEVEWSSEGPTSSSRTNTQKRCPLCYRGLECKRRKSRNTWSNRQNRVVQKLTVFSIEHTGHSKHPLPTAQEKFLHMDITRWSILKSDWLYSLQPKMKKHYTVSKNKTGCWLWLRSWTPYCQIQT